MSNLILSRKLHHSVLQFNGASPVEKCELQLPLLAVHPLLHSHCLCPKKQQLGVKRINLHRRNFGLDRQYNDKCLTQGVYTHKMAHIIRTNYICIYLYLYTHQSQSRLESDTVYQSLHTVFGFWNSALELVGGWGSYLTLNNYCHQIYTTNGMKIQLNTLLMLMYFYSVVYFHKQY